MESRRVTDGHIDILDAIQQGSRPLQDPRPDGREDQVPLEIPPPVHPRNLSSARENGRYHAERAQGGGGTHGGQEDGVLEV